MQTENRSRLTRLHRDEELLPLKRAKKMTRCALYWIPVSTYPVPTVERAWMSSFLDRFSELMLTGYKLRSEVFLQQKTVYPELLDTFLDNAIELFPMMGLGQRPGQDLPNLPTAETLKPFAEGKENYDFRKYLGDYCYWFVQKEEKRQRELFWGYGGMTMLFLAPDPKTKISPLPISDAIKTHAAFANLFKRFDPDKMAATAHAMGDSFRKKSLELFADEIKKNVQLKGMPFAIPLLTTKDFFDRPEAECEKWFELFDIYIGESLPDNGVLIASKMDLNEELVEILREIRKQGLRHPLDQE